jgi:hypothetical protein
MLPLPVLALVFGLAGVLIGIAVLRRGRGWPFRLLALAVLALALLDPRIVREERTSHPDVAVIVADRSPSQGVGDRTADTDRALAALTDPLGRWPNLEVRVIEAPGDARSGETRLLQELARSGLDETAGRLAGVVLITDGQVHDAPSEDGAGGGGGVDAPVHVLLTGSPNERDRRLVVESAPAYGLVGAPLHLGFRVEDVNADPGAMAAARPVVRVRLDGREIARMAVAIGQPQTTTLALEHGGRGIVELEVDALPGEVSPLNNRAAVAVNGVRDRLRVLLISGQPHSGERTWRNLLKADPGVDLVHFTILRPPEKDDITPLRELSLIVFPVQELFEEKLYDFDLIIFDRYAMRSLLPIPYIGRIAEYVRDGGAVLLSAGPESADARGLFRTELAQVLPASPTGRVVEQAFRPELTEIGRRHPVTAGLPGGVKPVDAGEAVTDVPASAWGRWYRLIEANVGDGVALMQGPGERPLLVLGRMGEGRVALMLSDHIWLWARQHDGGGPSSELLRRLAHWLMKEPQLDEEQLAAAVADGVLRIERRSLKDDAQSVRVTGPSGEVADLALKPATDGVAKAEMPVASTGLYRIDDGEKTALAFSGRTDAPEFTDLRATADRMAPLAAATGGGIAWVKDGIPNFRPVAPGRDTAGQGWMGLRRNDAHTVTGTSALPLLPALLFLAVALGALGGAWWREGH